MKLNLGCGYRKSPDFLNVDHSPVCEPDLVLDLEATPWPWPDDSVDEVVLFHVLEHLGRDPNVYFAIIKELYRVCRADALIRIAVPHPRHDNFQDDPTHVRAISPQSMTLFSKKANDQWKANGDANSPLAHQLGVDFELEESIVDLAEPYRTDYREGRISKEAMDLLLSERNNVATAYHINLRVRKQAVAPAAACASTAFLFEPDWSSAHWRTVLLAYVRAFAPGEPVALVIPLGAQPALQEAQRQIVEVVAASGQERFPDVVLLESGESLSETLRRFESIQWVWAAPGGAEALTGPAGARLQQALKTGQAG